METQWAELVNFLQHNAGLVVIIVMMIIAALLCIPDTDKWEWLDFIPRRRGRMLRKDRRKYVERMLVDGFVDHVETQVYNGVITRDEAKETYRKMKQLFPIRDLFPSPRLLKEKIQKRLQSGDHAPVTLPGKPVKKPKHMFDKSTA